MRNTRLAEYGDHMVLTVEQGADVASFTFPVEPGPLVLTKDNVLLPIEALQREVVIADRRQDISVAVEWYRADDGRLVRRDAHVVTKHPGVVAEAIAASIG